MPNLHYDVYSMFFLIDFLVEAGVYLVEKQLVINIGKENLAPNWNSHLMKIIKLLYSI